MPEWAWSGSLGWQAKRGAKIKSWAHTYLVGAVTGTMVIVAAVLAFVALVSLPGLHEWPISGLGGGKSSAGGSVALAPERAVAKAKPTHKGGSSVAIGGATSTATPTNGTPGKRAHTHTGPTRDIGVGVGSPTAGETAGSPPLAKPPTPSPGSPPPSEASVPSAPSVGSTEAGGSGSSGSEGRGEGVGVGTGGPTVATPAPPEPAAESPKPPPLSGETSSSATPAGVVKSGADSDITPTPSAGATKAIGGLNHGQEGGSGEEDSSADLCSGAPLGTLSPPPAPATAAQLPAGTSSSSTKSSTSFGSNWAPAPSRSASIARTGPTGSL
jgi:large repetitive protein